jgi:hypothetical protein
MKLNDSITKSVAASVSDVVEGKTKKEEVKYPHMMYSPEGEEVEVKDKAEHEKYAEKGYTHEKPEVKEVEEPRAKGEKEFKAKHPVKKSGEKEDGTVVKEMTISLDEANIGYWFNTMPEANKFYQKADKIVDANPPTIVKLGNSKVYTVELNGEKKDLLKVAKLAVDSIKEGTILEKLKAGRGKANIDIDHTGEGIPEASKKYKLKFKKHRNGFDVSGEKKNILAYLQSKEYDMDSDDIEELFPELLEGNMAYENALVKKAVKIASSMGGAMTPAVKKIEKLKKGLSDHPEVKKALQLANEANEKVEVKTESDKEKYQRFFQSALKKFGVKSPAELEGEKKKEFFDYVDKNYEADNEED